MTVILIATNHIKNNFDLVNKLKSKFYNINNDISLILLDVTLLFINVLIELTVESIKNR